MNKYTLYTLMIAIFLVLGCKKKTAKENIKLSGNVFGTTYQITYADEVNYQSSIDSLFYLVNKSLSTYIPTSDISKINKGDSTIVVDDLFLEVFQKSKKIHKETNGYFDITVGNLVNAWGFGPKKSRSDLDSLQVRELMKFVGLDKVTIEEKKIKKKIKGIYLDVNSIAKGYGIDFVGRFLESRGVVNYLVEIGGEIRARGLNKKGKLWRVGIDNPNTDGSRTILDYVTLKDQAMASSGNYRKFRVNKVGKKYVHTVNPITGFATESNLLSATVYGTVDCADVDAYATAFMAMGLEKTKIFLKNHKEIKAVLLHLNRKDSISKLVIN